MLIAAAAAAIVALLAGITGTWSPCGLSSVETLGSGLGDRGHSSRNVVASIVFSAAAIVGGVITFGLAGLIGESLQISSSSVIVIGTCILVLACGLADLRFMPVRPQIPNQVPESVRWRIPLAATGALYGLLLGLGFTTYLLTYAMWALVGACILLGSAPLGALVGVAFGIGRALPVILFVGTYGSDSTQKFIDDMERRPMMLKGMRRVTGFALVLAAVLTAPASLASAAPSPTRAAWNPSVYGGDMAFETASGSALRRTGRPTTILPGRFAAVGGGSVAWWNQSKGQIELASRSSLEVKRTIPATSVDGIALDAKTLVFRQSNQGRLQSVDLSESKSIPKTILSVGADQSLSRPSVSNRRLLVSIASKHGSILVLFPASGGRHTRLRSAGKGTMIGNPSLNGNTFTYVETNQCFQSVLAGSVNRQSGDRVALRVRSQAVRDTGVEWGYTNDYNAASLCPRRSVTRANGMLWSTALSAKQIWVTLIEGASPSSRRIISVALPRK